MQRKTCWGLSVLFIILFLAFILISPLPVKTLALVLRAQNHTAEGFDLKYISFLNRQLMVGHLHLLDEIKDLEVQNLKIEWQGSQIKEFSADKIFFRDRTKPNLSLKSLLEKLRPPEGSDICIEKFYVGEIRLALSYSAEPSQMKEVSAENLCLPSLRFQSLSMTPSDWELRDHQLLWHLRHHQFSDLSKEAVLEFPGTSEGIQLLPRNAPEILSGLESY